MTLEQKIEALLFYKGEPQTHWELAVALRVDPSEIPLAVEALAATLATRGVTLVRHGESVMLGTTSEMSEFFEAMRKDELSKDLSKAALETLSIILYRDGATRSDINFIRGVNASYILRNLEVRGLIERGTASGDARQSAYKPTLELLSFMGVTSVAELPDYDTVQKTLAAKLSGSPVAPESDETL